MSGIFKGTDLTVIPPRALRPVASVIAQGNEKYSEADWLTRDSRDDLRAALGHILECLAGSDLDGSGESHVAHAAARLLFVLERQERGAPQHAWRPFGAAPALLPVSADVDGHLRFSVEHRGMTNSELDDAITSMNARVKAAGPGSDRYGLLFAHLDELLRLQRERAR